MIVKHLERGLIHYLYGNGAGKTSSSFGIVLRAIGNNLSPLIIQFLKESQVSPSEKKENQEFEIHGLDGLKIDISDIYREYTENMKDFLSKDKTNKSKQPNDEKKIPQWFNYGEFEVFNKVLHVPVIQLGTPRFIYTGEKPTRDQLLKTEFGLRIIERVLQTDSYDVVVLDEIITAVFLKMVATERLVAILKNRKPTIEVILTGREKIAELMDISDYITQFHEEKHPYNSGIMARKGIEF